MSAQESLQPRQFLYHEAHRNDRDSIRSKGLLPGREIKFGSGPAAPAGVYLSPANRSEYGSSMNDSSHFGYDRWRADVTGLDVQADPTQKTDAFYTSAAIPPERLRIAKFGSPDWQKNI